MRIASYFPNDPILEFFTKYSKHTFVENGDDKCTAIFVGSVTQWKRIPRNTGLPLITHCWDLATNWRLWCRNLQDYQNNVRRDSEIAQQLHLLWESDLVISCSEHTKNVLYTMGIESVVEHNFYDGAGLDKILEGRKIEKKNRIIQISRYALNKRFHLTLQMWATIQDKYPDWELMFIGPNGDIREELNGCAIKRVTILDEQNRVSLVTKLAESRILVQPSLNEGMGLTPLEARHVGLDVICSDMPWVHEFGYATKLFEPENPDSYAQAVEDAIANPFGQEDKNVNMTPQKFAERFDRLIDREIK